MCKKQNIDSETLKLIVKYLDGIEFGSLTITVQNGKIIQLEKTEKKRL